MRSVFTLLLLGALATGGGCNSGGGNSGGTATTTQPAASRADAPASPGASPSTSPPKAAKDANASKADATATTRQVLGLPAGWEVAPRAVYTARQAAGQVTVTAKGENPTGGFEVKLFESPLKIWPPQWILAHKKPTGPVTQAITKFEATASFKSDRKVATVIVNDAGGRRTVSVAQAQN